MDQYVERVVDLIDPSCNRITNMSLDDARDAVARNSVERVRAIAGSFAIVAREQKRVRLARSLDRPMRYFLAKRQEGPALVVSDRIDRIAEWLRAENLVDQFHSSYTRMTPAHHIVEIHLIGCPDPDPVYTRFFDPPRNTQPADLAEVGRRYIGALAESIRAFLKSIPADAPVGVAFSGGVDSGAVFLTTYWVMRSEGMNLGRLKAFTLDLGAGPDLEQARSFLKRNGLELFLEPVEADPGSLDIDETLRVVEDYKLLDIEAATMALALCRGIRSRYPDWKYLLDGDGGDENLKDYPIHENPELTIRSVLNNRMLYQEGWGVGTIKHSLTYSGGLSRSYARTYATARHLGFEGFSPFMQPDVIAIAEGLPFIELTGYDPERLYPIKGELVSRGVEAVTGLKMTVNPKRRFQHGVLPEPKLRALVPQKERTLRQRFLELYSALA